MIAAPDKVHVELPDFESLAIGDGPMGLPRYRRCLTLQR
jgi:hypothetical protein